MESKLDPTSTTSDLCSIVDVQQLEINERALIRKIDWRIVPILFLTYLMGFLDKVIINYANVMGIQADLGMTGNDFSNMATALFVAFAVAEFPQGMLLQRFSVTRVLGLNVLLWGIIVCCCAACTTYASLLALRILLGILEAVIAPALIVITSAWYTKTEATPRYGLWYCGLGGGQIVGGFVSYGAQHAPAQGLAGWRIMFLVVGAVNIVVALLCLFFLPERPETATFLTPAEKAFIALRLRADLAGIGPKRFSWPAVRTAFLDIQLWLLALLAVLGVTPSGVVTSYSSILIQDFGYSSPASALLNTPSGLVSIAATLLASFAITRGWPRTPVMAAMFVPTLIGAGLMSFLAPGPANKAGCLAGIYLVNFVVAPLPLVYSLVGANFPAYSQRVTAAAVVSGAFGVGNIVGPLTFRARDKPEYLPAKVTVLVVAGVAMVVNAWLGVVLVARNRRAERRGGPAVGWGERRGWKSGGVEVMEGKEVGWRYCL